MSTTEQSKPSRPEHVDGKSDPQPSNPPDPAKVTPPQPNLSKQTPSGNAVPFDDVVFPWESLRNETSEKSSSKGGQADPQLEETQISPIYGKTKPQVSTTRPPAEKEPAAQGSGISDQPTQVMKPAPRNLDDLPTQANRVVSPRPNGDATHPVSRKEYYLGEQPTQVSRASATPSHSNPLDLTTPVNPSKAPTQRIPPAPMGGRDALPNHVDVVDMGATQVSRSALVGGGRAPGSITQPQKAVRLPGKGAAGTPRNGKKKGNGAGGGRKKMAFGGCLVRVVIVMLFLVVLGMLAAGAFLVYQYFTIAATLPSVEGLKAAASQFETTRIYDRNGDLLYELLDPNAGRRTYVPLNQISPYVIAATLATEDKEYYSHPGFDPLAIARALIANYTTGEVVSGASTITQQLARALLMTSSERTEISVKRKAREIILAAEITRRYSKDEILEIYLNEIYYGNLAYGIQAAAETYFNTTAGGLDLAQAAFLAGLPQSPANYDVFTNRDATLYRLKQVLTLMYTDSKEKGCIYVSTSPDRICLEAQQAADAYIAIDSYTFTVRENQMVYPHWVNYIRYLLEQSYDAQTIYRSGFQVYTTLDPKLQTEAERIVKEQVDALADKHVTDGALVALKPSTGEILAMVGSADFYNDAIAGQINMALKPRQPGSSIKPLTYAAAFEKGWTPATLIWDVPSEFPPSGNPNDTRDPYKPVNYDGKFHGPVTVRTALANSYNIPAVKTLNFVGIYDDPNTSQADGLINFAKRMGITTLNRDDYGLSLTLGGGEVTLLDMTSAFGVFANSGSRVEPMAITKITDYSGNVIYQAPQPVANQVLKPEYAYLISSILSDNAARTPMFGANSVLNLPFQAAAKTGTTNDYRDNWTMGYTPDLVVGTWIGNADWTPMEHISGIAGAAPIWSQFMQIAEPYLTNNNPSPFVRPAGIVDKIICSVSGTEPSDYCPSQRSEIFYSEQLPLPKTADLWQKVQVDSWTNLAVSSACEGFSTEKFVLNISDKWAMKWINETDDGKKWATSNGFTPPVTFAPDHACTTTDPRPTLVFVGLNDHQTIFQNPLDLYAVVNATSGFKDFYLEYGVGESPTSWTRLVETGGHPSDQPQKLLTWNLDNVPSGIVTLRLYMDSTTGTGAEKLIRLNIQAPTPTPTPTLTPTPTPTLTPTPTPTETPTPKPTSTLMSSAILGTTAPVSDATPEGTTTTPSST